MSNGIFRANRYNSPSLIKCEQCGRVAHHTYKIPLGEHVYNLCSGACVQTSMENYENKKDIKFVEAEERSPDYTSEMDNDG